MHLQSESCKKEGYSKRGILGNEHGQSSVLIALSMVVFIAFLAFLANIGQAIHDKMLTQAVADAAALSAANVQAIGLNEIADLNAEIKKLDADLEEDIINVNKEFAEGWGMMTWAYYTKQIMYCYKLQADANENFAKMAREVAQKVVDDHNERYKRVHPSIAKTKQKSGKAQYNPVERWTLEELLHDGSPKEELASLIPGIDTPWVWIKWVCRSQYCSTKDAGYFRFQRNGTYTAPVLYNMPESVKAPRIIEQSLSPGTKVYYRARIKRNEVRPFLNMEKYGFDVHIPEIIAYAQAQPHRGHIKNLTPDYEARLVPLWNTYPNETSDPDYLQLVNDFKH